MTSKTTLEEMAIAVQEEADRLGSSLHIHAQRFPDQAPDQTAYRKAFALESAAQLLRILGTFEDRSREFVNKLLAEHRR